MAIFKYKVKSGDTLQLGDASNTVNVLGQITGIKTETYESITTDGTGDVVDPNARYSFITSAGAHTVTLADGTYDGQVKSIILSVDGGTVTLTPANFADGTSLTFAYALDTAVLVWDGSDWNLAEASGVAIV